MILVLLIHEVFHVIFIKAFNQKINNFELTAFGGMMKINVKTSSLKEVLIYSGGIIGNIIFLLLLKLINIPNDKFIYKYNILMIIVNILPIVPLDGSNILRIILEKVFPTRKALKLHFFISVSFLISFSFYSIVNKSLPFITMAILLIYHNICFYKSIDDIILNRIIKNIK